MACNCKCCDKDTRKAADNHDHTVVDRATTVLGLVSPLLATAVKAAPAVMAAKDRLAPAADDAKQRFAAGADQAKERVSPLADAAKDRADQARKSAAHKVAPAAATAAVGAAALASNAKDQVQPHLEDLADRVQPTVDAAREKVVDELLPQLLDLLRQAGDHPVVNEASKRGQAAAAALRGDLELPEQKKKGAAAAVAGTVAKVGLAGAVAAAVAVAVRQFLATKDDAWTAHQPSAAYKPGEAYKPGTDTPAANQTEPKPAADVPESGPYRASTVPANPEVDGTVAADDAAEHVHDDSASTSVTTPGTVTSGRISSTTSTSDTVSSHTVAQDAVTSDAAASTWVDRSAQDVTTEGNPRETMSSEGGPVGADRTTTDHATTDRATARGGDYGEGSYVGEEPPAEYSIKANERSKKYHTVESAGYDRTIADVWFNSPEAAEKAGFTADER